MGFIAIVVGKDYQWKEEHQKYIKKINTVFVITKCKIINNVWNNVYLYGPLHLLFNKSINEGVLTDFKNGGGS